MTTVRVKETCPLIDEVIGGIKDLRDLIETLETIRAANSQLRDNWRKEEERADEAESERDSLQEERDSLKEEVACLTALLDKFTPPGCSQ
jgi:chromosome segregation ATPase